MGKNNMIYSALALISSIVLGNVNAYLNKEKFYIIAHMANNEKVAGWALDIGANALEIDVTLSEDGSPDTAYHGHPCDCWCFITYGVCTHKFSVCSSKRPMTTLFDYIMSHPKINNLALIYIDSKISDVDSDKYDRAGQQMISLVEEELLKKGFKGKILIAGLEAKYINSLASHASWSSFQRQIYVSNEVTQDHSMTTALEHMANLNYTRKMFSAGVTACSLKHYHDETVIGSINKAKGVISEVITWTLDKKSSFSKYYKLGARGVVTNDVEDLVEWANDHHIPLYSPDDEISETSKGKESLELHLSRECKCSVKNKGCVISSQAPAYSACQCHRRWNFWKWSHYCSGEIVGCSNSSSPKCGSPDTSYQSCLLGSGNCKGY